MSEGERPNEKSLRWPRVLAAAIGVLLLVVGVRAAWRSDAATAITPLILAALLAILVLVFSADLEELTWKWRNMLLTFKQRPPPGAVALGDLADDLRSLEKPETADAQAEITRLRERLSELAAKAEAAEADAYATAEVERTKVRSVRAQLYAIEEVRAALELRRAALDVIARVAAERGWRVQGDVRLEPPGSYGSSRVNYALHTGIGLVLIDVAPITGGGNTLHLRSVEVEFTKRWAGGVKAFLVIPDGAIGGGEVAVPGGPGKGDVEAERTRVVHLSELEAELRALA